MSVPHIVSADVESKLTWPAIADAILAGHLLPKAKLGDQFLSQGQNTLLSRSAWIEGLGIGVKSVTVMPENGAHGLPSVQGAMLLFDDQNGVLKAIIDSDLVTKWKTAGDSVLGARLLANPDPQRLVIMGAGTVAANLVDAYRAIFPTINDIKIWNRNFARAEALAAQMQALGHPVTASINITDDVGIADIIACATMAREPVLFGEWVSEGTHIDLIGAFKADMREADDDLLVKSSLFVDSRETTISHIGELMMPIAAGVIAPTDILADFYDLAQGKQGRTQGDEITVFKNGGGAHLDVMVANVILNTYGR